MTDERKAFEKWLADTAQMPSHMRNGYSAADVEQAENDAAWEAWKARALLEPTPLAASIPQGWRLVPVEPTASMHGAGDGAAGSSHYCRCGGTWIASSVWRAMLAAAPSPTKQPAPTGEQQ